MNLRLGEKKRDKREIERRKTTQKDDYTCGYFSAFINMGKKQIHTNVNCNKWQLYSVREQRLNGDKDKSGGAELDENIIQLKAQRLHKI